MRELFIEELAEVRGGQDPLQALRDKLGQVVDWERIRELFVTTYACGEETTGPC
ncbi:MAG: hypothetical protein M3279_04295 [Actinomycetota bacterium]|nr:hypothetical protein [Actinomycetota bacterium]